MLKIGPMLVKINIFAKFDSDLSIGQYCQGHHSLVFDSLLRFQTFRESLVSID